MVWFRLCHLVNIKLWTNINFFSILGVLLGSPYRNKIGKIILQNVQVVFFSHYCTYSHLHYSYALCNLLVRYLIVRYKLASPPDLSCNTFYLVDDLCLNFIGLLVLFWLWKRSCWRILEKWKEREMEYWSMIRIMFLDEKSKNSWMMYTMTLLLRRSPSKIGSTSFKVVERYQNSWDSRLFKKPLAWFEDLRKTQFLGGLKKLEDCWAKCDVLKENCVEE